MTMTKHYIGQDLTGFDDNGKTRPISRLTLNLDNDNYITAGDDTGTELIGDCPYATQPMVDSLLKRLKGYQYQMFDATSVNLDPSAELGDGVTAGGIYSVISRIDDNGIGFPSISAPGSAELEDEYPTEGPLTKFIKRESSSLRSTITKTAEEIKAEIIGEDGAFAQLKLTVDGLQTTVEDVSGKYSTLQQTVDEFNTTVQGINSNYTAVKQTADKIEWLVQGEDSSSFTLTDRMATLAAASINLSGYVTFSNLSGSYNDTLNKTIIDGSLLRTGKIQGLGDGNQSYWNLGTGELVTYKMTAHEMEADGKLTCGTEVQQIKVADGSIHGYGWKGNQHSQSDFGYIDFTGVCHNIDNPNEVWYGIQISSELLRISTDMISVSNTKSTEVTTWAGINSTFKWPYIGKFEQTGFDDAGIPMFKWMNVTAEAQFINGICTKFAVWDGYS